jgi:small-conductance mechanosensitive channel
MVAYILTASIKEFLDFKFFNNTTKEWLIAFSVFILAILVLKIFKTLGIRKLKKLAEKTKVEFDDLIIKIIESIGWPLYLILALYLAFQALTLPSVIGRIVSYLLLIVVTYYLIKSIQELIDFIRQRVVTKRKEEDKNFEPHTIKLLADILKVVVWLIALVIVLQNLGYNISALIAGLGIGGIAIAFALQNILTDIFASFSIYFDKPFQIGDFIIIGSDMGVVKKIGIKSTRIQTLQGQELIVSNKELTEIRINNYKKMEKRRVVFGFGVEYSTQGEKLKKIPDIIKGIFDKIELADLDRVHFKNFGDFSLNFEVVYYMKISDYNKYMDTQQEINLALKEAFERENIVFAFPTQMIYLEKA